MVDTNDNRGDEHDETPPIGTFDRLPFDLMLSQYDYAKTTHKTCELGQALLMTANLKQTASQVSEQAPGGQPYFLGDTMRLSDSIGHAGRLLGNLGVADKSTNFMLEQRSLLRAQEREGRDVRNLIDSNIVDGLEYVKTKQQIAVTRQRVKQLLDVSDLSSDEDQEASKSKSLSKSKKRGRSPDSSDDGSKSEGSDTQVSSQEAQNKKKITGIIKQLRLDACKYLGNSLIDNQTMSLQSIYRKLSKNRDFRRRRETKAVEKQIALKSVLKQELEEVNNKLKQMIGYDKELNHSKLKSSLSKKIGRLEQVLGLEKRIKEASTELMSVAELDQIPLNSNSFELQNMLFSFCGLGKKPQQERTKGSDKLFGKLKRLPSKSPMISGFPKDNSGLEGYQPDTQTDKDSKYELVRVVGLEPEKLFGQLDKYKVQVNKLPKFSNVFDSYETFVPGLTGSNQNTTTTAVALPGSTANQSVAGGSSGQNFARSDGRSVISLGFNPYELDSRQKQKIYDGTIKDIKDHRSQQTKAIAPAVKDKQEQGALKRAWTNIAKRDIPKAYRAYQKYKADYESNTKKLAVNCLKEIRKKVVKTQRLAKEAPVRAKKITKEMLSYWKRRDRELADIKRKKEKFDKELKKRQQEEEENLLQKKRLEYLMKQSEIYAHFMSNKMGMSDELEKTKKANLEDEVEGNIKRVQVDMGDARKRIAQIINEDKSRLKKFDADQRENGLMGEKNSQESEEDVAEEDLDPNKFDLEDGNKLIETPSILNATLKHYQLKGLRWLDNLYEQGINGILADEMGLGKTIQAISLMAHIAEHKGTWGPFLVIVPVSTLHNWQHELERFCPSLRVLPFFGTADERKKLGKFLDPKSMANPSLQIHVLITSYNLIVNNKKDQDKLMKIKWNYMILDEAQAIKNNLSRRWKVLLQFQARNRLLLTGTPIQNTMAELWALLHFIMPKLFDNHEQFSEWFSKDIEASSMDAGELNKHQLKRLHAVLKPFMLRRLKRDVEQEIAPKTEKEIYVEMTFRQRTLYQRIRSNIRVADLFQMVDNKKKLENLMNLVMQFRKVCNHPDLFERRCGRTPFAFSKLNIGVQQNYSAVTSSFTDRRLATPDVRCQLKNPITMKIPKLLFDECFLVSDNNTATKKLIRRNRDNSLANISIDTHLKFFNIFNTENLHRESQTSNSGFGILNLLKSGNGWSSSQLSYLFVADPIMQLISLMHFHTNKHKKRVSTLFSHFDQPNNQKDKIQEINFGFHTSQVKKTNHINNLSNQNTKRKRPKVDINVFDFANRDENFLAYRPERIVSVIDNTLDLVPPMVPADLSEYIMKSTDYSKNGGNVVAPLALRREICGMYVEACQTRAIELECPTSGPFNRYSLSLIHNPMAKKMLIGDYFKPYWSPNLAKCSREDDQLAFVPRVRADNVSQGLHSSIITQGILNSGSRLRSSALIDLPSHGRLVTDCAKMQVFADLITRLHREKHRCLVFCQMTRMIDILEDFMTWKKLTYFRMDGSTSTQDRGAMVDQFQNNDNIFCFLLSTRAGGLGLNLVAADTVIFYDNDWNPTMDEQAQDRVHRIGQTKPVTVYRIITRGTVEEKVVRRAKQKQSIQSTVYGDTFKKHEVVDFLMHDEGSGQKEEAPQALSFIKSRKRAGKKEETAPKPKKINSNKQTPVKGKQSKKEAVTFVEDTPMQEYGQEVEESSEEEDQGGRVNFTMGDGDDLHIDEDDAEEGEGKRGRGRPKAKQIQEMNAADEDDY